MKANWILWLILAGMYGYLAYKTRKSIQYIEHELDPNRYSGDIIFRRKDGKELNLREFMRVVYTNMERTNWIGFVLAAIACAISLITGL